MRDGTILVIIGTRPEAIKLAPVARALAARGLAIVLIFTGQHPSLDPAQFGLAGIPFRRHDCRGSADPLDHATTVASALARDMTGHVELVIVQGDTSSALGGARAAHRAGVAVAHVEAGLRSFDPAMPWPEEDNRVAIDRIATLLFAPTATSAANLRAEAVQGAVYVTGNTGIDALRDAIGPVPVDRQPRPATTPSLLVTCHRRENWGAAFAPIALALRQLARRKAIAIDVVLHPNPAVATTMRALLGDCPRIDLLAPMAHSAMLSAMRESTILLSDSGGIQEEAPALGVPLLVLRDKTERPEGIASGNMRLVGTRTDVIVAAVRRLLDDPVAYRAMSRPALPFGDGHAAARIAQLTDDFVAQRTLAHGAWLRA
jgi:UDP-N-acetylglucosamine 2-epimerase (non-hydrolysing)